MASHAIIHVELPARDLEASSDFYEKLFGWKINRSPNYVAFQPESGPGGGFNPLADESSGQKVLIKPGDVFIYVDTEDIDQTLEKAVALGGQVLIGRTEISGAGWFAVFIDPTGNRMGLLHYNTP